MALAALLGFNLYLGPAALAQQQNPVPDAPAPQAPKPFSDVNGPITPGLGAGKESPTSTSSADSPSQAPEPGNQQPAPEGKDTVQTAPPELLSAADTATKLVINTTYVEVPVTVKDKQGKLVAGLTWRDFKVYENNTREPIRIFTVDPTPLSIAFVIDQSMTSDVMDKVDNSLDAVQGALASYDELAVYSYSNGAQDRSHGFTGAQSTRTPFVLAMAKAPGADMQVPINSGALAGCPITQNGVCVDPNIQPGFSAGPAGSGAAMNIPKEIHTLNDAILAAAKELSRRPMGRRRVIYVVSDGKEYGSKATLKEVIRYLQTNNITVYATLVGSSATWGVGYLDRFHLPFTMNDNILYKYIAATGGQAPQRH